MKDGRLGIVLADVSGKGMAAALLMSATRGALRSLAEACCTPGETLAKLNCLLVEDFPVGKFVTLVYAILDPASRTLTFANAGHLRPLLVSGLEARFLETETGLPLGLSCGSFSETKVHFPENSSLLFYSDGITEASNAGDEEYGGERLKQRLLQADASPESILQDVRAFANGAGLTDDATVAMVRG
jgi:sigma-B regulation protein RsbU (phosphoserine phosphatase)